MRKTSSYSSSSKTRKSKPSLRLVVCRPSLDMPSRTPTRLRLKSSL